MRSGHPMSRVLASGSRTRTWSRYTGETTLALIGRGLLPENAARFGFTAVAPMLDAERGA